MFHKLLVNYNKLPILKKLLIPQIFAIVLGSLYIFSSMHSIQNLSDDYMSIKEKLLPALEKSIENNMILQEISNDFTFSTLSSESDFLEDIEYKKNKIEENLHQISRLTKINTDKYIQSFFTYYHYTNDLVKKYIKLNKMIDDPQSLEKELKYYKDVQTIFRNLHYIVKDKISDKTNYLTDRLKTIYLNNFFIGSFVFILFFILSFFIYNNFKEKFNSLISDIAKIVPEENIQNKMIQFSKDEFGSLAEKLNSTFDKFNQEYVKIQKEKENALIDANIDVLTNLYNRRYLNTELQSMSGKYTAMALIDIDYFKTINDTYGHAVGDAVLILLAKIFKENISKNDIVARWGGEEFIILFAAENKPETLFKTIEKLREIIARSSFNNISHLTVSIGATLYKTHNNTDQMLKTSDNSLYKAKLEGRNKSIVYELEN